MYESYQTMGTGIEPYAALSPLSDFEIAEEAQRVMWRILQEYYPSGSVPPGYYQIRLSHSLAGRMDNESAAAICRQLPFQTAKCLCDIAVSAHNCRRRYHILVPYWEIGQVIGVGLSASQKRYRKDNGQLAISMAELLRQLQSEADAYFQHGEEYIWRGKLFSLYRFPSSCVMEHITPDGVGNEDEIYLDAANLPTFLPDVSSVGMEIVAVKDSRYQPMACLTSSLRKYVAGQLEQARQEKEGAL